MASSSRQRGFDFGSPASSFRQAASVDCLWLGSVYQVVPGSLASSIEQCKAGSVRQLLRAGRSSCELDYDLHLDSDMSPDGNLALHHDIGL